MASPHFYVAYRGSYEDPLHKGGLSGPYKSRASAEDWVSVLRVAREVLGAQGQKQPLYIVRCLPSQPKGAPDGRAS